MKPRPPPNQIVPAETTHYCKPCFRSIGGVWWETKLRLVKFFVVLFEGTSESPTNQTDRGVDTSDCFPQLVIIIIMWVQFPRSNVRLSTKNQKKCIHNFRRTFYPAEFFLFFLLTNAEKCVIINGPKTAVRARISARTTPICKISATSSTSIKFVKIPKLDPIWPYCLINAPRAAQTHRILKRPRPSEFFAHMASVSM